MVRSSSKMVTLGKWSRSQSPKNSKIRKKIAKNLNMHIYKIYFCHLKYGHLCGENLKEYATPNIYPMIFFFCSICFLISLEAFSPQVVDSNMPLDPSTRIRSSLNIGLCFVFVSILVQGKSHFQSKIPTLSMSISMTSERLRST